MDSFDTARRQEYATKLVGATDVGIGQDLLQRSGLSFYECCDAVMSRYSEIEDGDAFRGEFNGAKGRVIVYWARNKSMIDVGTRKDAIEVGMEKVCDELDLVLGEP